MSTENHNSVEQNPVVFLDIKFGAAKGLLFHKQQQKYELNNTFFSRQGHNRTVQRQSTKNSRKFQSTLHGRNGIREKRISSAL